MTPDAPIWTPSAGVIERANVTRFQDWLHEHAGRDLPSYEQLWRWSVDDLDGFWSAVCRFYDVLPVDACSPALADRAMPGARWFPHAELNYAEQVLDRALAARPAVLALAEENAPVRELGADELRGQVGAFAAALAEMGVAEGDRVAAYLPNIPEAVVAMLATTSLGAIWTVCAPDFGTQSVIDRFAQVEPKVLVAVDGYRFAGRPHDRRAVVEQLLDTLPTVRTTVLVRSLAPEAPIPSLRAAAFEDLVAEPREPRFARVPFDHPLWILFSSGTTGTPKGIVHSHGGIVVEHLKSLGLCMDLGPGDRYFFHSSTSWMAWNYLVGGLLHGATIVLYNGSPGHGNVDRLWTLAAEAGATVLGMGSAYAAACQKASVRVGSRAAALRVVIPTGSPLAPAAWAWLAEELPDGARVDSICGGTDVCTAFFGGSPLLPVHAGEISCRWLGIPAEAWDEHARPVVGQVGEFVVTGPMPSMPVMLWNDRDGERYRSAYFDVYPGVWRQGDWITISERGSVVVSGRSDATLNRHGVRIGSAEIYGAVERLPEVADSLVVGLELPDGDYYMPLFVVPAAGSRIDDPTRARIVAAIRTELSPRHVPDEIIETPAVPRTLTGKKLELPVKRILLGEPADRAAALGSVDDPGALLWFEGLARPSAQTANCS